MIDILITSDFGPGHRRATITPDHAAYGFLRDFTSVGDTITVSTVNRRMTTKWEVLRKLVAPEIPVEEEIESLESVLIPTLNLETGEASWGSDYWAMSEEEQLAAFRRLAELRRL